jgi:ubiquinone/menaquinone biosynthesis C-methylase UbiE
MRNYIHIDKYLNELADSIYLQPSDSGHSKMAEDVIMRTPKDVKSVLDIGCGSGFSREIFEKIGIYDWTGVTLGADYEVCKNRGLKVYKDDFSFLLFDDNSFDLSFSRHVLEHSPMPILTLKEWYRVSRKYLLLVLPNPKHFLYYGLNHIQVLDKNQWNWLAAQAGWKQLEFLETEEELQFLFIKDKPRKYAPFESKEYDEKELDDWFMQNETWYLTE